MRDPNSGDPPLAVVTRAVRLPDPLRVARSQRAPELGPRLLFFSGGSALRSLSRALKSYTHNSIHLLTPFDSGGSSALLRQAFNMPSIGDLRNRLVALADESVRGNPEIYRLFSHRLAKDGTPGELVGALDAMVQGTHPLVSAVPDPLQRIVQTHLRFFWEKRPDSFDLRGANIGNLLLAGGYLANDRDLQSVLFLFSKLLEVRGIVHPVTDESLHLVAELEGGERVFGQHVITGKECLPPERRITGLGLVDTLDTRSAARATVAPRPKKWIRKADLICYPMGSFYSSVVANLLPSGVGEAIAESQVPKVYVPNVGTDPEQVGMKLSDAVDMLFETVRHECRDVELHQVLNLIIVDSGKLEYGMELDVARVEERGVQVLRLDLAHEDGDRIDPVRLSEVLVSLG
jgi:CofD-related protein of GAK system